MPESVVLEPAATARAAAATAAPGVDRTVAVVTGGAGGIGLACARVLDADVVLLADRSAGAAEDAAAELRAAGRKAVAVPCDVADRASVAALADAAAAHGTLRALVHSAGLAPPGATDPRRTLEVNLCGTIHLLDAFEPLVTAGTVGACIASLAGHRRFAAAFGPVLDTGDVGRVLAALDAAGYAGEALPAYSLSKHGVIRLCRGRAAAWGARGGRLASVSPGLVLDTAIGALAAGIHAGAYARQSAVGRAGTAADVAAVVAFVCSPAAAYVTGTDVAVDGGVLAAIETGDPAAAERWHAARP